MEKDPEKSADGVVDFGTSLVKKLQGELSDALTTQDEITKGSRIYWQRVHAVHQAVVMLLDAATLPALLESLQDEAAPMLGLDAIQLFMSGGANPEQPSMLMRPVPAQLVLPRDREAGVVAAPATLAQLFPDHGSTIAVALALPLAGPDFRGLLALGSRDVTRFDAGLAFEPYIFLARVVERLAARCSSKS